MSTSPVTTSTQKPPAMPVLAENIPEDLRGCAQWVVWNWNWNGSKWDKPPLHARTGKKCSKTDSGNWFSFDEVLQAHQSGRFDGIGFCFSKDDPFSGVDFDDCRDPNTGAIADWATWIIETLDGYAEISPSGYGVKVFVRGKLKANHGRSSRSNIEMYSSGSYFTVTGHLLGSS